MTLQKPGGWFCRITRIGSETVKIVMDMGKGITDIFILNREGEWINTREGQGGKKETEPRSIST